MTKTSHSRPSKEISKLALANFNSKGSETKKPAKQPCSDEEEDEVIIISDSRDIKTPPKANVHDEASSPSKILRGFKINLKKLG